MLSTDGDPTGHREAELYRSVYLGPGPGSARRLGGCRRPRCGLRRGPVSEADGHVAGRDVREPPGRAHSGPQWAAGDAAGGVAAQRAGRRAAVPPGPGARRDVRSCRCAAAGRRRAGRSLLGWPGGVRRHGGAASAAGVVVAAAVLHRLYCGTPRPDAEGWRGLLSSSAVGWSSARGVGARCPGPSPASPRAGRAARQGDGPGRHQLDVLGGGAGEPAEVVGGVGTWPCRAGAGVLPASAACRPVSRLAMSNRGATEPVGEARHSAASTASIIASDREPRASTGPSPARRAAMTPIGGGAARWRAAATPPAGWWNGTSSPIDPLLGGVAGARRAAATPPKGGWNGTTCAVLPPSGGCAGHGVAVRRPPERAAWEGMVK